jgi:hypothetical protein
VNPPHPYARPVPDPPAVTGLLKTNRFGLTAVYYSFNPLKLCQEMTSSRLCVKLMVEILPLGELSNGLFSVPISGSSEPTRPHPILVMDARIRSKPAQPWSSVPQSTTRRNAYEICELPLARNDESGDGGSSAQDGSTYTSDMLCGSQVRRSSPLPLAPCWTGCAHFGGILLIQRECDNLGARALICTLAL